MHNFLKLYSSYIDEGYIYAKLYDLGSYPAAIKDETKRYKTFGEVYKIKPGFKNRLFKILDRYEGYIPSKPNASLYIRAIADIYLPDKTIKGYTYFYNQPLPKSARLIKSGKYKEL